MLIRKIKSTSYDGPSNVSENGRDQVSCRLKNSFLYYRTILYGSTDSPVVVTQCSTTKRRETIRRDTCGLFLVDSGDLDKHRLTPYYVSYITDGINFRVR